MASPRYQPVGPIDSSSPFLLIAFIPNQGLSSPYVATIGQNGTDILFLPVGSNTAIGLNRVLNNGNLLQFRMTGSLERAVFSNGTRSLLPIRNPGNSTVPIVASLQDPSNYAIPYIELRSPYSKPPSPNLLLSGASYTALASINSNPPSLNLGIRYQSATGGGVINSITAPLYPIAVNYVAANGAETSTRTCSAPNSDPLRALEVFWCSWCGANCLSYCSSQNVPSVTWTNQTDCSNGFNYVYCAQGFGCGQNQNGNCYAACTGGQDCRFSVQNKKLVCAGPPPVPGLPVLIPPAGGGNNPGPSPIPKPKPPINNVPWYESGWFILVVVVIIFLILLLIYVYTTHERTPSPIAPNPVVTNSYSPQFY